MRRYGPFAKDNRWGRIAIQFCMTLTVGTAIFGFVVLPIADRPRDKTVWAAICTAFGTKGPPRASSYPPPIYASTVRWTAAEIAETARGDVRRGRIIAENCQACHGAEGINRTRWIPNLAGMRAETLVKQLLDYKSGHRRWPVMNAVGAAISRGDIRDVSAYYASLAPAAVASNRMDDRPRPGEPRIGRLIFAGDPSRGIAPCASCHGLGGIKRGAPVLAGLQAPYVERQLVAFQTRSRENDEGEQMRIVAAKLLPEEIIGLAAYLGLDGDHCRSKGKTCER